MRGGVAIADCDSKAHARTEKIISSTDGLDRPSKLGRFTFGETQDVVAHFLKQQGLSPKDVVFDKNTEMGGDPGLERVIMAGAYIGVFGEEFFFVKLNVQGARDISDLRVLDLTGDGRMSIVVKTIERAGSGSRQILHVFRLVGSGIRRTFAAEIGKQEGGRSLRSKVSFPRHRKKTDILIEAGAANGWNADTYREAPASDVIPILLPWEEKKKARYRFAGDEFEEVK